MPTNLTCEDFGLTQEQMTERLIETMAERLLGADMTMDYEGEEGAFYSKDKMETRLSEFISERIDKNLRELFEAHIMPRLDEILTNLVIPHTNQWGEKKREPETLIEHATRLAENFLKEPVNHNGKSKSEDPYSWTQSDTRLMHTVKSHLRYSLDQEIKKAAKDVNSEFARQVVSAVSRAVHSLKVSVQTTVK